MRVSFGEFVLDRGARQLLKDGEEVRLGAKGFALLDLLLAHRPNVVARERIRDRLWPGTFVSESTLATVVTELRAALGEEAKQPRFVRTVHGVGFAFCAEARETRAKGSAPPALVYRLVLSDREVTLEEGENVLGRVEDGILWLDSPTVSRRHACVLVEGGRVVLQDLGSKNGTFVGGRRITAPTPLADGDAVRLGRVSMEFRAAVPDVATETDA